MDFRQVEDQFKQLKARYQAGELTEADFKAQLQDLMVQDAQGDWWMIGYETEKWYRFDGANWVQADPSEYVEPVQTASKPPEPKPTAPLAEAQARAWLLPVGIVVAITLLAISTYLIPKLIGAPTTPTISPANTQSTLVTYAESTLTAQAPAPSATPAKSATDFIAFTDVPSGDPSILFQDDFSNPDSGLLLVSDWGGSATASINAKGQYTLHARDPHVEVLTRVPDLPADVRMDVDATLNWRTDGKYGLICRYQDEFNFYLFMVDGDWFFIGRRDGNSNRVLQNWKKIHGTSFTLGSDNIHLGAECQGYTLSFFVNGVQQVSRTDDHLADGDVGLFVLGADTANAETSFDNFIVRRP